MSYLIEIRQLFRLELMFETMFKTKIKTMFRTVFKTMSEKSKKIRNKNMSILKITNTKKRGFIVNFSECAGDLRIRYELSKLFKPVTDMQKD